MVESESFWFKRNVTETVNSSLFLFMNEYLLTFDLTINSQAYILFNSFVLISFNEHRKNRYSVSKFAEFLQKNHINSVDQSYLITRYIDSLYLLAHEYKVEGFII